MKFPTRFFYWSLLTISFIMRPSPALAVQAHGGAEGLVSHQIGHVLFVFGIGYLFYIVRRSRFENPGWSEFKVFLWLLILWNLLTFTGHWMREFVDPGKFLKVNDNIVGMTIDGPWDAFFYLTRLDHLLLVPAFFMLLLGLRKWRRQP
jgi:hypothetical protein